MAFNLTARIGGFMSGMGNATAVLNGLSQRIGMTNQALRNLDRLHRQGRISAEQHSRATEELRRRLDQLRQSQDRLRNAQAAVRANANRRNQYRGEVLENVGLAATLAAPIRSAMRFEDQMADVRKVIDFDTPEQFKAMGQDIMNMSKRLPVATDGIAQIVAAAGQAGIARQDLAMFAEDASKMSVAFDTTAEDAGQSMAVWRTTFKLSQDGVRDLADQINYLSNISPTSAKGISNIVTRIGSLGGLSGLTAGQVAALGSAMPGLQDEVAATSLKKMFTVMTSGFAATKTQREMMGALGFDTEQLAVRMQQDATGAIMDFMGALKKLPPADQMSYISEIFGEEGKAGIGILLQNLDIVSKNFKAVGDASTYAGSMQKEFDSRASTTSNQLQLLSNNMTIVGITAGNALLPHISALSEKFIGIAEWVNNLATQYPGLTEAFVVGTAAVIGLKIATFALGYGFSALSAPFVAANAALTIMTNSQERAALMARLNASTTGLQTAAQWLFNTALYGCPIIWIIAGIVALVAAGYLLYKNWDTIKAKAIEVWGAVTEWFGNVYEAAASFISNLPATIAYGIGYAIGFIATLPERMAFYFQYAWILVTMWAANIVSDVISFFGSLPENASNSLSNFLQAIDKWGSDAYNSVVNWFNRIPDAISSAIGRVSNWLSNLGSGISGSFSAGVAAGSGGGVQIASNAAGGIYERGAFLTTFAETNPEAAIPLDGSPKALSLWAQAGEILGVRPGGGSGVQIEYKSGDIIIYGNPEPGQVQREVENGHRSFLDYLHNEARLSFSDG
ncbi:phage-related minor tail protein [Methylomusa anaerophila]|uniref:Phage-related minor tail protein n=2 Tax=Methylomusa anaerophila TaxID=1930071 RepID=A0A348AJ09_9FIRM|nr:phage-related minor tail protein [Methylomusa anaerophila]